MQDGWGLSGEAVRSGTTQTGGHAAQVDRTTLGEHGDLHDRQWIYYLSADGIKNLRDSLEGQS